MHFLSDTLCPSENMQLQRTKRLGRPFKGDFQAQLFYELSVTSAIALLQFPWFGPTTKSLNRKQVIFLPCIDSFVSAQPM